MQPRHRVSRTAIELIKRFEGCRQAAAQLPDGRWTIGHGHTLTARQGARVSQDDAEALLLYDLIGVAHALNEAVFTPLTQNQFDALASFTFNIGVNSFHQSAVLRRLNEGALIQAACAMELWRKADIGGERIVIDALVRRRACEKALFLTPPDAAWVPAPSPVLRPLLDSDAEGAVPRQTPVEVTAAVEGDQLVVQRDGQPSPPAAAPDDDRGPAVAAAEAVTARLSTIFQDSGSERLAEGEAGPESTDQRPVFEDPVPFFLRAPEPEVEPAAKPEFRPVEPEADGPENRELFSAATFDEDREAAATGTADPFDDAPSQDPFLVDDGAPYGFVAPAGRPLPDRPESGLLTLVALAVLGLIFFGGGIFWATNARPNVTAHLLGPQIVGMLAGIAGVAFFAVAVYLLLERLGRAAERQARHRP